MPCNCAVAICKNIFHKNNKHIRFFRFPKEANLRKEWIEKCARKDKFNPDNSKICSIHFKPDDFENYFKIFSMGFEGNLLLKKDAVPSENIPYCDHRSKEENEKVLQSNSGINEDKNSVLTDNSFLLQIAELHEEVGELKKKNICLYLQNERLKKERNCLTREIQDLKRKIRSLKKDTKLPV